MTHAAAVGSMAGMETFIPAGPFKLRHEGGRVLAYHAALKTPMEVNEAQLGRWLMRQLRESLTFNEVADRAPQEAV